MKTYLVTMGGYEVGWSRHNDEGVHRDYQKEAERLGNSALNFGIEPIIYNNEFILNLPYYEKHKDVLEKTSFGFAYKAICLFETAKKVNKDDIIIWADSNHIVNMEPTVFVSIAIKNGIFARDHIWTYYPQKDWCRRDTFVNMGCDEEKYWNYPQLQDSVCVFCKSDFSESFLKEWKDYSLRYDVMFGNSKYENFPTFREHRHNQAIFSMLCCKYDIPYMNRTENVYAEYIIPEIDTITPEKPIDNSSRKQQDRKDIR